MDIVAFRGWGRKRGLHDNHIASRVAAGRKMRWRKAEKEPWTIELYNM